jgi:hypothetical protein
MPHQSLMMETETVSRMLDIYSILWRPIARKSFIANFPALHSLVIKGKASEITTAHRATNWYLHLGPKLTFGKKQGWRKYDVTSDSICSEIFIITMGFEVTTAAKQMIFGLLGCKTVWNCRYIPTSRRNILPPTALKMETLYSSEALVSTYSSIRRCHPETINDVVTMGLYLHYKNIESNEVWQNQKGHLFTIVTLVLYCWIKRQKETFGKTGCRLRDRDFW